MSTLLVLVTLSENLKNIDSMPLVAVVVDEALPLLEGVAVGVDDSILPGPPLAELCSFFIALLTSGTGYKNIQLKKNK